MSYQIYNSICDPPVKKIHDSIHGFIYLSKFSQSIIDTKIFQRLRNLSQLGTCKYVYPNATHTRFEHSIGTYHVANKLLLTLPQQHNQQIDDYLGSIPELKRYYTEVYSGVVHPLDLYVCELIKIASLCHDLGHGPFSHVFDDIFLKKLNKQHYFCASHEERSCVLLRKIIEEDVLLSKIVKSDEIQFMETLINPQSHHRGFIYQIVSNSLTSLDVDKFDYLQRDIYMLNFNAKIHVSTLTDQVRIIDNNFVYPEQAVYDIYNLFSTRHKMHVQVYCHKVIISTQYMVVEIFTLLDDILGLSDSINDMGKFCNMTEGYIFNSIKLIENNNIVQNSLSTDQLVRFNKAKKIMDDLETRNLYGVVCHFMSSEKVDYKNFIDTFDDKDQIIFFQNKVGYISGENKCNPFDNILVYKTKDPKNVHKINKYDITCMMPSLYQEYVITIFYKDKQNTTRIKELYDYFHTIFKNNK